MILKSETDPNDRGHRPRLTRLTLKAGMDPVSRWNAAVRINDLAVLRRDVAAGRYSGPRALLWRVLLLYKTLDQPQWNYVDSARHKAYLELQQKHKTALDELSGRRHMKPSSSVQDPAPASPRKPTMSLGQTVDLADNPLYQSDPLGPEADTDDAETIRRDVERTLPDVLLFRNSSTQRDLAEMLYLYAQQNPDVRYRQGMHELLAPLYYVVHEEDGSAECWDVYSLFLAVMEYAKLWYLSGADSTQQPFIVTKSLSVQENIVRYADPALYKVLVKTIEPQLWGIRWFRLLFGREFAFNTVLKLWDVLFAIDDGLVDVVDYVCAVMLLRVRKRLLGVDDTELLTTLFNYHTTETDSEVDSPYQLVKNALYLKRHPAVDGGIYVARQYDSLFPSALSYSSGAGFRANFDSIRDAAKTVGQSIDRVRDAFEGPRRSSEKQSRPSPVSAQRNQALAQLLTASLGQLQSSIDDPKLVETLATIAHVRNCLVDFHLQVEDSKESPKNLPMSPSPPSRGSTESEADSFSHLAVTPNRSQPRSPLQSRRHPSLEQGQFSWILGENKSENEKVQQGVKAASQADPFDI